jgi:hypothetical protein
MATALRNRAARIVDHGGTDVEAGAAAPTYHERGADPRHPGQRRQTMKFMMTTFADAEFYTQESFSDEQQEWLRGIVEFMHQFNAELEAAGELVTAEGLNPPSEAKTIRPQGDDVITTDGPFAEAKEYLAGFWIIDVASVERATELAAKVVRFVHAPIEIRPIGEAPEV